MHLEVVLSTYRQPTLLEKVLTGYAIQTHEDFRLVVADDGSGEETGEVLERARKELGLRIERVWHEDDGFRKCRILNRALERCGADYLVFSDGDCIPRPDFLATHARLARPGRFLSGGYVLLSEEVSRDLGLEDIRQGRACEPGLLRRLGQPLDRKMLRLVGGPLSARLLDILTTTKATWNGHNASGWREDLLRANGFDERMRYGGEDRELGERLEHAGIRARQIRHRAVVVHLWHGRPYVRDDHLQENRRIRDETERLKRSVTPYGIRALESPVDGTANNLASDSR